MALVYLGLVAFSCLLVIITPLRPAKPQYTARLQSNDTTDGTTTVIIGILTAREQSNAHDNHITTDDSDSYSQDETASKHTNIDAYTRFQEDLLPLANYSYTHWEVLGRKDMHFRSSCGYRYVFLFNPRSF